MLSYIDRIKYASAQSLLYSLSTLQRESLYQQDISFKNLQKAISQQVESFHEKEKLQVERIAELERKLEDANNELKHLNMHRERIEGEFSSRVKEEQAVSSKLRKVLEAFKVAEARTHPIYGKLLFDFGFKQIYATNPSVLTNKEAIPVWMKQRLYNEKRAEAIAKAKQKDKRFGFPGVITIYEENENLRGILDDLCSIGALKILLTTGCWSENAPILTEVFPLNDPEETKDLFLEINQCQPVKEIDLPGHADDFMRDTINMVASTLAEDFSPMFSQSTRWKMPHVNLDDLRQKLFESSNIGNIVKSKSSVEDAAKEILMRIRKKNEVLDSLSDEDLKMGKTKIPSDKAIAKCRVHKFYLGVEPDWPEKI